MLDVTSYFLTFFYLHKLPLAFLLILKLLSTRKQIRKSSNDTEPTRVIGKKSSHFLNNLKKFAESDTIPLKVVQMFSSVP